MPLFLMNSMRSRKTKVALLLAVCLLLPLTAAAGKKKKPAPTAPAAAGPRKFAFDPKALVWPSPPNTARIRWLDYFAGEKIDYAEAAKTKAKASWMDRLAGSQSDAEKAASKTFPFQLVGPYGIAVDSKG